MDFKREASIVFHSLEKKRTRNTADLDKFLEENTAHKSVNVAISVFVFTEMDSFTLLCAVFSSKNLSKSAVFLVLFPPPKNEKRYLLLV